MFVELEELRGLEPLVLLEEVVDVESNLWKQGGPVKRMMTEGKEKKLSRSRKIAYLIRC